MAKISITYLLFLNIHYIYLQIIFIIIDGIKCVKYQG